MKVFALVLSLGVDTLAMASALGLKQRVGRLRIAATFALFEAGMLIVGLLLGHVVGRLISHWAAVAGGLLLIGLAVWLAFFRTVMTMRLARTPQSSMAVHSPAGH